MSPTRYSRLHSRTGFIFEHPRTLLYLIRDLGRLFISENFPLLVGLITSWSLIFSKDFILLVVYYIVVADQDVIVDDKSAIQSWSAITQRVPKQ